MDWNRFISPKSQGVEVSLTTYCNANCPLCARTDPFTGVKKESIPLLHISFDVYKKFVVLVITNEHQQQLLRWPCGWACGCTAVM